MPQQLIYTSAPRGIVAGRSGYCTVARSAAMRDALALRLEQLSYYRHLCLGGAGEHPIFAYRIIDIRGARFHVLSRIQDAGLDFTGRTNFIAHHVALTPEERNRLPTPPIILRDWPGWTKQWNGEPQLLQSEDWSGISALARVTSLPARTWQEVTGDAVNGYGLLELGAGTVLRVDGLPDAVVLDLLAESLELLEVRENRHDWRNAAWQFTFTTALQEQDNPSDFRWRCVQGDASARSAAAESRALRAVVAAGCTEEEAALARAGRRSPRFLLEPQNAQVCEGDIARFQAQADGVPNPNYQWFKVDRDNNREIIAGAIQPELVLATPPRGLSRYALCIQNSAGEAISRTVVLSVELQSSALAPPTGATRQPAESKEGHQKSAEEIDQQRLRIEAEERELRRNRRMSGKHLLIIALPFAILIAGAIALLLQRTHHRTPTQSITAPAHVEPVSTNLKVSPPSSPPPNRKLAEAVPVNNDRPLTNQNPTAEDTINSNTDAKEHAMLSPDENFNLPPGWVAMAIGAVSATNYAYLPNQHPHTVSMSAAAVGFGESGDNLLFVCTNSQRLFSAALRSIEPSTSESGCGIMVRESRATNSAFLFIGASSDKLMVCLRDTDGNFYSDSTNRPATPMRLTLQEEDGKYGQACSFGQEYSQSFSFGPLYSVQLNKRSLIGFALASGNMSNIVKARFAMVNR